MHGGGFYHFNKYRVAPPSLPALLHWSYWESYATWMSGFALLTVLYFATRPRSSSILACTTGRPRPRSPARSPTSPSAGSSTTASAASSGATGTATSAATSRSASLVFVYVCVAAWIACHLFAGRAAFLLTGAMLATIMTANVAMVIIPGQRKVVAALRAGKTPDPNHGKRGKQRSVHNTYVTLPVVIAMISNHDGHADAGALELAVADPADGRGRADPAVLRPAPQGTEPLGADRAGRARARSAVVWLAAPPPGPAPATATIAAGPVPFAAVQAIVTARCVACHNAGFANKNVRLDSPASIVEHARDIEQQAVVLKAMPMNNATGITDDERATLGRWVAEGATGP